LLYYLPIVNSFDGAIYFGYSGVKFHG